MKTYKQLRRQLLLLGSLPLFLFLGSCDRDESEAFIPNENEQFIISVSGIREVDNETLLSRSSELSSSASSEHSEESVRPSFVDDNSSIYVNTFVEATSTAVTRGIITPMAEGTRFRVVVFNIGRTAIVSQAEYSVMATGVSSSAPLVVNPGSYEIVAYSYNNVAPLPALATADASLNVANGQDFLYYKSNQADKVVVDGITPVKLNLKFDRQVSCVRVKLDASATRSNILTPGVVTVSGLPDNGTFSPQVGKMTTTGTSGIATFVFPSTQGFSLTSVPQWVIPHTSGEYPIRFNTEDTHIEGFSKVDYTFGAGFKPFVAGGNYTANINFATILTGANCYIINSPGIWEIDVTKKGNGKVQQFSDGMIIPEDGKVDISRDSDTTETLWETTNDLTPPAQGQVVKVLNLANGKLTIQTTGTEGNALIAVRKGVTVLWSWHIWRINQSPEIFTLPQVTTLPTFGVKVLPETYMMDRNLGAMRADPTDGNTYGMLYQWGRKDPFLGSVYQGYLPVTMASNGIYTDTNGRPLWEIFTGPRDNIDYSILNPHRPFYLDQNTRYENWTLENKRLWGCYGLDGYISNPLNSSNHTLTACTTAKKTIYDPCPLGFVVGDNTIIARASSISIKNTGGFDDGITAIYSNGVKTFVPAQQGEAYTTSSGGQKYWLDRTCIISSSEWTTSGTWNSIGMGDNDGWNFHGTNQPYELLPVRCVREKQ